MTTTQYPAICAACIYLGFNAASLIIWVDMDNKGARHVIHERGSEFVNLAIAVESGTHEWSPRGYWQMNDAIVKSVAPITSIKGTALCSTHAVDALHMDRGRLV